MGFSISYIAVKNAPREKVLKALSLASVGEFTEAPEEIVGVDMKNGWYVVSDSQYGSDLFKDEALARLSASTEVLLCMFEEHVGSSMGSCWHNGKLVWSVSHDCNEDDDGFELKTSDNLPQLFIDIKAQIIEEHSKQVGSDPASFFELPIEMFKQLTGFTVYRILEGLGDSPFETLKREKAPLWKSIFKRI